MPDKVQGIGISWLWMLPDTHPFQRAALAHDQFYDARAKGTCLHETSEFADRVFYELCVEAADDSRKLKALAWLFYRIVRVWGFFNWPKPKVTEV